MGYSPLYLIGRNRKSLVNVQSSLPPSYNVSLVTEPDEATSALPASVAIGTIPADQPIDEKIVPLLETMLGKERGGDGKQAILLEMAYKPAVTALMRLATEKGWKTVQGLEVLAGQGVGQFELWTGIRPLLGHARKAVFGEEL
ncbi:MAG: hypothetical protein Q9184_008423 [Pyrenodesmia sp. 2 TL-2023]